MVYETKGRMLYTGVYEKYKLSKKEHMLLIVLSAGNIRSCKEIAEYIYGKNGMREMDLARKLVYELNIKTKRCLKIKVVKGYGYKLLDEIYFE